MNALYCEKNCVDTIIHAYQKRGQLYIVRKLGKYSLNQAGIPLSAIKERLGHANLDITEIYTDHVTEQMNAHLKNTLYHMF